MIARLRDIDPLDAAWVILCVAWMAWVLAR